jgi:hypothetical protein
VAPHPGGVRLTGAHSAEASGVDTRGVRGGDLGELGGIVAVARDRVALARRRRAQIAGQDTDPVAEDAMVEQRGRVVQDHHVDPWEPERAHERCRKLRGVPERGDLMPWLCEGDRDVDVTVSLR